MKTNRIFLVAVFLWIGISSRLKKVTMGKGYLSLQELLSTSSARAEARLKLSAASKTNNMLGHAYDLHDIKNIKSGKERVKSEACSVSCNVKPLEQGEPGATGRLRLSYECIGCGVIQQLIDIDSIVRHIFAPT